MTSQTSVLVVGDSILMESVAIALLARHTVAVDRVCPRPIDVWAQVDASRPEVVVFELGTSLSTFILSLHHRLPGTKLIGIDSTKDRVVITNSRECPTRSMVELRQVLASVLERTIEAQPARNAPVEAKTRTIG